MGILRSDGTARQFANDDERDKAFDGTVGDEEIRDALHGAIDRFFDRLGGKSKKDGAAASLDGSAAGDGTAAGPIGLVDMMRRLATVSDRAWGRYILSSDMLRDKIDPDEGDRMIEQATACGREWADRVYREWGTNHPSEIAGKLGIAIGDNPSPMSGRRALFAQYLPDAGGDRIEVLVDPLNRYDQLRGRLIAEAAADPQASASPQAAVITQTGEAAADPRAAEGGTDSDLALILPTAGRVRTLLVGHELFHAIEDRNEASIYTRTATISLWKVFGKENRSTVRGLGEIGAGAFSRALVGAAFCPFALDVLLMWSYSPDNARALYRQIITFDV